MIVGYPDSSTPNLGYWAIHFMALTYTGANGIFTQVGKPIKYANGYLTLGGTTLPADEEAIADILEAGNAANRRDVVAAARSFYSSAKSQVTAGWRNSMAALVTQRLLDKDTVLDELDLPSGDIGTVLDRLITQMVLDAASVDASIVTISAVTAGAANVGNGIPVLSKVLDGLSSPGSGMPPHIRYNGIDSELCITDSMRLECVADSQTSGRTEGGEIFRWHGNSPYPLLSWEGEGSGEGPGVIVANAAGLLSNKDFELWTGTPAALSNWTLGGGVWGTTVLQEATAADVHRGSYAMKFLGTAATPDPLKISQLIQRVRFKPRKRYAVSFRYKGTAGIAVGALTVQFEAPAGYTAAASEKVTVAAATLAANTTYTHANFFINMPATIPVGMELVVKITGALTDTKSVWIDSLTIKEVDWHNGHGGFISAGSVPFRLGDFFTYGVTNDAAGTIQEWFRKVYGVQFPSNNAGAETIVDSLAE